MRNVIVKILKLILPFSSEYDKINYKTPLQISYIDLLKFKIGLIKRHWPADSKCLIVNDSNVFLGINSKIGRAGNYIQGNGGIYVGDYVQVAPNVGILSQNHDVYNHNVSVCKEVIIGDYSWVGMNSVILPGVVLGTRTIVAAGSVVTKSFPKGYCVIGGNPAKLIKELEVEKFDKWTNDCEYYGFYRKEEYERLYPKRIEFLRSKIDNITI